MGVVKLAPGTNPAEATALATQYCTAWYAACMMVNLQKGDRVLVHAAAGGVGTALVQIAKWKGCEVFGTARITEKLKYSESARCRSCDQLQNPLHSTREIKAFLR